MKVFTLFLAFFTMISLSRCDLNDDQNPDNKIIGTGPIVTENLNLDAFDKIENTGVANIYVTLGEPQSVILKAQQNIMDIMIYRVVGNTLRIGIRENTSIQSSDEIRFEITVSDLNEFKLIGVGNFQLSGDFQDELLIALTGVGNVDAYDTEIGVCDIVSTGVGDCRVNVRDELNVTISGVGSIYYRGNPAITQSVSGMGNLINDN